MYRFINITYHIHHLETYKNLTELIYNNMEENPVNERRNMYRVEIRKNQLESYFKKRRYQLLAESRMENSQEIEDQEKCDFIVKLIDQFSIDRLVALLGKIADIDLTLSLFCRLTGYSAHSFPLYFQDILTKIQGFPFRDIEMTNEEDFSGRLLSRQEDQGLRLVCEEFRSYWKAQSKQYTTIISLLKRVDNMNCLINQTIIRFLSVMANILLLFRKAASIAGVSFTIRTLVGQQTFLNYQINSTINLLLNILTANDQLLAPFMNAFLETNGCNIQQLELYYNMFLVREVQPEFTIKLFQYYVRLLEHQKDFFLNQYRRVIWIMYTAIRTCPLLHKVNDINNFVIVGEKLIKLLGGLLLIINMRYDCTRIKIQAFTSQEEDNKFLQYVSSILQRLSTNQSLVRTIMQQRSIVQFILNHIGFTQRDIEQVVLTNCLLVLISASQDHHSLHFFLNEEPRILIKLQLLFEKYLSSDIKNLSMLEIQSLRLLVDLLSRLADKRIVAEKLIESNMLLKMALIYFRTDGSTAQGREIKTKAEEFFLKLADYLKKNAQMQRFYQFLFDNREVCLMMISIIRYTPQRAKLLLDGLNLIDYISYSCSEVPQFQIVKEVFLESTLLSQLEQLQLSDNDMIIKRAEDCLTHVKMLRNMNQCQYLPQDDSQYL